MPLDPPLPEIALIGRSNVGKSSLLNAFVGRRIARVSATPGKTRALTVYEVTVGGGGQNPPPADALRAPGSHRPVPGCPPTAVYFLDLPGYGYASASKAERAAFRGLIAHTLDREHLAGVIWLLDVRRELSREDRDMQELFAARGTRVLAAVTKSDKLPRGQRSGREQAVRTALGFEQDQIVLTSARSREGIADLQQTVASLIRGTAA